MVHTVRAVKHDALFGKGFGEILGGLSLTSTGRTCWSTSQVETQSSHESHIALIGQGGDHKSERVTKILITIWEIGGNTLDIAVIIFPIVSKLRYPFESINIINALFNKLGNDILSVHVDNDQCIYCDNLILSQPLSNKHDSVN